MARMSTQHNVIGSIDNLNTRNLFLSLSVIRWCENNLRSCPSGLCSQDTALKVRELENCLGSYSEALCPSLFNSAIKELQELDKYSLNKLLHSIYQENYSLWDIASQYEHLQNLNQKKKSGTFYTPRAIAKRLVQNSFRAQNLISKQSDYFVLDPACGSGLILLELLNHYFTETSKTKINAELVTRRICGVDRDPVAVSLCRLLLSCMMANRIDSSFKTLNEILTLPWRIVVGNSLLDPTEIPYSSSNNNLHALSWRKTFPEVMQAGGFHCIVGNPPYGLSRNEQISTNENKLLLRLYSRYRAGKVNKYLLFIAKSLELLHGEGSLSFIVPNAWLGITAGKEIRKIILEKKLLKSIFCYDESVFSNASVEAVIFNLSYKHNRKSITIKHYKNSNSNKVLLAIELPYKVCSSSPEFEIPLHWSAEAQEILDLITKNSLQLNDPDSPFISRIALQAYATGKGTPAQTKDIVRTHAFHSDEKIDANSYPYLEGVDVSRYNIEWSGKYLSHGKWLAEPQKIEFFTGPRILIREILNVRPYILKAAFTDKPYLYNKSVLHIVSKNNSDSQQAKALTALLNSKLASFIFLQRGKKSQRKLFPKLVNQDLKYFPIARDLLKNAKNLAELHDQYLNVPSQEVQYKIDREVFEVYGLSRRQISFVNRFLKR